MNIILILMALNISVVSAEPPPTQYWCGYYSGETIVLNLAHWCDQNETLYHEMGHALFTHDEEVKDLISKYPAPRYYYRTDYPTDEQQLNEKVADYFAMYMKYPDFPDKFPEIKELFDRKLHNLIHETN